MRLKAFFQHPMTRWGWLVALILAPLVLWALPAHFFDDGVVVCPSRLLFDFECLGCGMTRAVMHAHHFDWEEAVYYNPGVLLIYPGLLVVWVRWTLRAWKHRPRSGAGA